MPLQGIEALIMLSSDIFNVPMHHAFGMSSPTRARLLIVRRTFYRSLFDYMDHAHTVCHYDYSLWSLFNIIGGEEAISNINYHIALDNMAIEATPEKVKQVRSTPLTYHSWFWHHHETLLWTYHETSSQPRGPVPGYYAFHIHLPIRPVKDGLVLRFVS